MGKLEKTFEKSCIDKLKELPNSYWMGKEAPSSMKGNADRLGVINGRFIALEIKRSIKDANKKTKTTVLQKYKLKRIREAGGYAEFVYPENWGSVYNFLWRLANG